MNGIDNCNEAEFLTKRQAAEFAGASCRTISKWIASMGLPHFRAGAVVRIPKSDLVEWMRQHIEVKGKTQKAESQNGGSCE